MAVSDMFKALSDENRLRIIDLLAGGELCVCELATELEISDALVSHHLKQLREAGLVRTRRVGRWLHCSLEPSAFEDLGSHFGEIARRAGVAQEGTTCCACKPVGPATPVYPEKAEEIWP